MDILESYFFQNNHKSSLFFKVDLGDLSEITMLQQSNENRLSSSRLLDFSCSFDQSIPFENNLKTSNMEEIKEHNSEHAERNSLHRANRRRGTGRQNKFSQLASKGS